MAPRLGNVLYWVAIFVAVILLLNAMLMGWMNFQTHSIGYEPALASIVYGFGAWLLGRVCLYVLAGR
jgi:hypothetical protein